MPSVARQNSSNSGGNASGSQAQGAANAVEALMAAGLPAPVGLPPGASGMADAMPLGLHSLSRWAPITASLLIHAPVHASLAGHTSSFPMRVLHMI